MVKITIGKLTGNTSLFKPDMTDQAQKITKIIENQKIFEKTFFDRADFEGIKEWQSTRAKRRERKMHFNSQISMRKKF